MPSSEAPTTASLLKADVLVVDDTPANLDVLMSMLQSNGYGVRVATNGTRALEAARRCTPDLIMLDVGMPDLDGYEVCRQLKEDAGTADVPVVFVSAHDEVLDKVKAFRAGGADYVTKPFHVEEVLARVDHQLALRRLQRAMERKNRELEQRNAELVESRHQLMQSQHRASFIFSALSDALPGRVLDGRYRLEERIGSGGFGVVFRGTHLGLDRAVAVKVFQPSPSNATPQGLERFRREGMSACRVAHPNAVVVLDNGVTSGGIPYLVMELLSGESLSQVLRTTPRLAPRRAAEIVGPVCDVLHAAHAAGIVHRDIKPENIVLHREGDVEVVKVVDFGLAKLVASETPEDAPTGSIGTFVGSADYVAPERLGQGGLSGRSDVYSVGVMLYRMLAGRLPFLTTTGDAFAIAMQHLTQAPTPLWQVNPEVPRAVSDVVMRALEKDPAQRPEALELARHLTRALAA